jgi:four helix bundle protein
MKKSVLGEKSFAFAVRMVRLYKYLVRTKKEFVLSKQLVRSGTSIGANVREALNAQSKADFLHKLAIVQKEAAESIYWIDLLHATQFINDLEYNSLHKDAEALLKIVRSIILTTKSTPKNS